MLPPSPTVLVVAAAEPAQLADISERPDLVIAADSGLHAVAGRGWRADLVVGDMDSVAPTALDQARREGDTLEQHEVAKDRSDLELALDAARRFGAASVHVVVRGGGRLDHQLANLLVLTAPELSSVSITASVGHHRVWVVRGRRALDLPVGAHLGLQPVGGPARLTTAGLAYPMTDGTLSPFAAHGIANEVVATPVVVEVDEGVVLAVSSPTIAG